MEWFDDESREKVAHALRGQIKQARGKKKRLPIKADEASEKGRSKIVNKSNSTTLGDSSLLSSSTLTAGPVALSPSESTALTSLSTGANV